MREESPFLAGDPETDSEGILMAFNPLAGTNTFACCREFQKDI